MNQKKSRFCISKSGFLPGAGDGARTRYLHLGKVALYQMSYTRGTAFIIANFPEMSSPFPKNYQTYGVSSSAASGAPDSAPTQAG